MHKALVIDGLKTALVLGNGPSVGRHDLSALLSHDCVGMNAAYRAWDRIGRYPAYYACLDLVVGLSHQADITRLIERRADYGIRAFFLRQNLIDAIGPAARVDAVTCYEDVAPTVTMFEREPLTTGSHAALWMAHLGYRLLAVAGVDGYKVEIVKGAALKADQTLEITTTAENPNYFFADYQKPGDRYNIPNFEPGSHKKAWTNVAAICGAMGVPVYNANPSSMVDAFPYCDLDALMAGRLEVSFRRKPAEPAMQRASFATA